MKIASKQKNNIMPINLEKLININQYDKNEIANACNVGLNTVNRWITGQIFPSFDNYIKLAKLLNSSVEYLLDITDIYEHDISCYEVRNKIKELRKSNGFSIYKLEKLSGVQCAIIKKYENNEMKKPRLSTYLKFANIFEVSLDHILGLSESKTWESFVKEKYPFRYIKPGSAICVYDNNKPIYGLVESSGKNVIFPNKKMISIKNSYFENKKIKLLKGEDDG